MYRIKIVREKNGPGYYITWLVVLIVIILFILSYQAQENRNDPQWGSYYSNISEVE